LGGWHTGFIPSSLVADLSITLGVFGTIINVFVFIVKCWLLVFVMMWVRWTLPRLRIDQVMMTCLKYLLPISCFLLVCVCLVPLIWNTWLPDWFRLPRNPPGVTPVHVSAK
jgi:NADH-quinone oxidoreductase subunit H